MGIPAFASYYAFNTLDALPNMSTKDKFALLRERLQEASANMGKAAADMRLTDYVGFFAVPEYYFTKALDTAGGSVRIDLYDEKEYSTIVGDLLTLSDRYNRVVILPGTVNWRRRAPRSEVVKRKGKDCTIKYEGFSSVPVCYGGDLLATYDKVMNDATINTGTEDTKFVPGQASPVFKVRDEITCGLEICGDFNEQNLSKATGPQTLDFELMLSGSNFHKFLQSSMSGIPVRDGGYFLHVDQAPNKAKFYNGVWCINRGSGWHGLDLEGRSSAYDPYTSKVLKQDMFGVSQSVGHVLEFKNVAFRADTTGVTLPGMKGHAGLSLIILTVEPAAPLDTRTGRYEVLLKVSLIKQSGVNTNAPTAGRTIHFKGEYATAVHSKAVTDGGGNAQMRFVCRKDKTARLIATFHGAKVIATSEYVWLGPGQVTKISTLKSLPHDIVPTYFTPL